MVIITLPLNVYFRAQIAADLEKQARAMGFACQISFTSDSANDLPELIPKLIDVMLAHQVHGIAILTSKRFSDPELFIDIQSSQRPTN